MIIIYIHIYILCWWYVSLYLCLRAQNELNPLPCHFVVGIVS